MMTALTDLLSSVMATGKLKAATPQEQAQNFANAMDDLLATGQYKPATGTDQASALTVDALSGDLKQPTGSAELQFVMDESTMDMIKSGQGGLSNSADSVSTRLGDAAVGQTVSGVEGVESSPGNLFNQTMSDLTTMSTGGGQPSSLADRQSAELTSAATRVQTVVATPEDALLSSDKTHQPVAEAVSGRASSDVLSTLNLSKTYVEASRASVQATPNTTAPAPGLNGGVQVAVQGPERAVLSESLLTETQTETQALKSTGSTTEPRVFLGEGLRTPSLEQAAQTDSRVEALADKPSLSAAVGLAKTDASVSPARSLDVVSRTSVTEPQQFGNEMATHVRVLKRQGGGEVKINLHPAELGRMSITVVTDGLDTRVAFVVETPQARQAVENALPRLRDMMDDAGLSLADSDVSEHHHSENAHDQRDSKKGAPGSPASDIDTSLEAVTLSVSLDPSRLVDTYI
ncbi:MAG: flagellar hook-length control protein FliK [Luminiphilus sp.]|nr:flagellar hook-length control protein FliK [Luminiphilus sp.]